MNLEFLIINTALKHILNQATFLASCINPRHEALKI
ncbi:hypothetical protein J2Z82_000084 [Virgibacillus litoralis]|uniref:Uncharacterized protein n=1 Tax=Virgibacillus litoralis TaxID=578221 RepID=A0ABS4H8C8_9BACI|nr:hypothetical protein [Virgibacillus litoralis]